ncbi:MAG: ABC transporter ATP-binding protein [Planctomycetota bacterium]
MLNAIVSVVQDGVSSAGTTILIRMLALQFVVLVVGFLLGQFNAYLNYLMGRRLSLNMNTEVIKKVSSLDYAFFENPQFYDMMTRAQKESDGKPLTIVFKVTSIFRGSITFISMGGLIASLSLPLLLMMVMVGLPLVFVQMKYGEKNYLLRYNRTEDMRTAKYVSDLIMTREYVPEILSFGLWRYLFKKWYTAAYRFLQQDIKLQRKQTVAQLFTGIFMTFSTVAATGYIIYINTIKTLSLSIGDIMMYSGAFAGGLSGLTMLLEGISGIYENALFLYNLIEFNKLEPHIQIRQIGKSAPSTVESIELQNVSFKYPGGQRYALRKINLSFNRSKSTLIVGANGAGKTTLIKLLIRLYDPTEGRILLNGVNIKEFEIEPLRQKIGVIFQEFVRYAFSARENIGCGNISDLHDISKIISVAKLAKADSFIKQLPRQYDTTLSRLFKNGHELSIGQWQRICVARLFMKNAPVFILDEPTASLDIETEAHLLKEISELSEDKICILVSHRMFRKDIADQIVVLNEGEIVEAGTYRSLICQNGEFARLRKLYYDPMEKRTVSSRTTAGITL